MFLKALEAWSPGCFSALHGASRATGAGRVAGATQGAFLASSGLARTWDERSGWRSTLEAWHL